MTRVLVVDDHPSPATSAAHALEAAGYRARVATSVDAALVELADRPDAVSLLVMYPTEVQAYPIVLHSDTPAPGCWTALP